MTACAAPAATSTPAGFTITDALGRKVTFASPPQRIALAGRAVALVTDAVYFFPAAPDRVVTLAKDTQGKDFIPVIDPNHANKLKLETQVGPEQVAAAKPDVVLLKSYLAETLGKPLESLGIPVVYLDFETPEQYHRDLMVLGQIFQDEARARQVIAFYQERTEWIAKALDGLADKPRVLLLYYSDKDGAVAFNVPPLGWIQTLMVEMGGGQPVWKDAQLGSGWTKVNFEQIAAWDADQVYIVAYTTSSSDVVERLKADPQWQALRATRQGQLYAFPNDYYSWDQPDTRWILGLTWLAAKIHPDRFPDLDMEREIHAFYRELYNLDDAAYQEYVQPNLIGDLP
ncbi:MAG: ABC transporter substrate-binding protein [Thermoflexales bacterium]|nr:ABC transporter substrate-binding protein [Thermoflexales bacterium]